VSSATWKEWPQPQLETAFGLSILNPDALLGAVVEAEAVLEAGAAAALDRDAENGHVRLLGHQLRDLRRRRRRQRDELLGALPNLHLHPSYQGGRSSHLPRKGLVCNTRCTVFF
jgi:hypothetical protein